MKRYLVWDHHNSCREDAKQIDGFDVEDAAKNWAERCYEKEPWETEVFLTFAVFDPDTNQTHYVDVSPEIEISFFAANMRETP